MRPPRFIDPTKRSSNLQHPFTKNTTPAAWGTFLRALQEHADHPGNADSPLSRLHVVDRVVYWPNKANKVREMGLPEEREEPTWTAEDVRATCTVSEAGAEINRGEGKDWTLAVVVSKGTGIYHCTLFVYKGKEGYLYDPDFDLSHSNDFRLSRISALRTFQRLWGLPKFANKPLYYGGGGNSGLMCQHMVKRFIEEHVLNNSESSIDEAADWYALGSK